MGLLCQEIVEFAMDNIAVKQGALIIYVKIGMLAKCIPLLTSTEQQVTPYGRQIITM